MSNQFQTAAVIGSGMMGPGIAMTLALGGVRSVILSRTPERAAVALRSARAALAMLTSHQLVDPAQSAAAIELITASDQFDDIIAGADIVIESAPEDMAFKQDLFARMDLIAKPEAVLASNTSGLSITAIASKCQRPERVLTTHFWNPPHLMPLVEIVKGARTSDSVALSVRDLLTACGKTPVIVKKDTPGQLGNRLQMALVREAVNIVEQGIADAEDVDLAARAGFGLRLPAYGIFEHQDIVGLDMACAITDYVAGDLYSERRAPELMRKLVREGNLGAKTGRGFYDWSKKSPEAVKARRDNWLVHVLRARKTGEVES